MHAPGEQEGGRRDLAPGGPGGDFPLGSLLAKRRVVVVIGIDDYAQLPKLRCAKSDALGVQKLFVERFGFEAPIAALVDAAATKRRIESLVEDELPAVLRPDDALVLFFAGHGTTRKARVSDMDVSTGYLAPVDATGPDQFGELVDMEYFLRKIALLPARHILVFLDACHSGIALGAAAHQYRSIDRFVRSLSTRRSRRVITSALDDEVAIDTGPIPGHSLFTGKLIEALNNNDADLDRNGIVTSSELALYLQQSVAQASGTQQTPDYGAFHLDDRGELVLSVEEKPAEPIPPDVGKTEPEKPWWQRRGAALAVAGAAVTVAAIGVAVGVLVSGGPGPAPSTSSATATSSLVSSAAVPVLSTAPVVAAAAPVFDTTTLRLPERPPGAKEGRAFATSVAALNYDDRDRAIRDAIILSGNVPPHLRRLHRVDVRAKLADGKEHTATIFVTRDYLAIGSDADFVRVSMRAGTAGYIADSLGCVLPTKRIVDTIYKYAKARIPAKPMVGDWSGERLRSMEEVVAMDDRIRAAGVKFEPGDLVAGHKKDIVVSSRMKENLDQVFIYGWFFPDGRVIQSLSAKHKDDMFDYSMGVRLVSATMLVDGESRLLIDVLKDELLAPLVSDEGAFPYRPYAR